jgi:hypothetical protein
VATYAAGIEAANRSGGLHVQDRESIQTEFSDKAFFGTLMSSLNEVENAGANAVAS